MSSEGASADRWFVRCQIVRWVSDDPQPGVVACDLVDASGRSWTFVGKYYDFTNEELTSQSAYPRSGYIACAIVARDGGERGLVEIDTDDENLRGTESEEGCRLFRVAADQLVPNAMPEWHVVPLIKIITATRK
jgi:hypothetical protein